MVENHRASKLPGQGEQEPSTLPWRLASDTSLVSFEKNPMLLCNYVCKLAREQGIADVGLADHVISPKMRPSVTCLRLAEAKI